MKEDLKIAAYELALSTYGLKGNISTVPEDKVMRKANEIHDWLVNARKKEPVPPTFTAHTEYREGRWVGYIKEIQSIKAENIDSEEGLLRKLKLLVIDYVRKQAEEIIIKRV